MKTREEFEHDKYTALKLMATFFQEQGYEAKLFTNMNGEDTVTIQVEDEGEQVGYCAVFERY